MKKKILCLSLIVFCFETSVFAQTKKKEVPMLGSKSQKCMGFSRVNGYTLNSDDKCLGLALTKEDVPWIMPRNILFKDDVTALVSDMGGWGSRKKGAVWQINLETKAYKKIYQGGDRTHGLAFDFKGNLLIGDAGQILRLSKNTGELETVVRGLPTEGSHPITHFIVLPSGDLVVNVGAPSNNCAEEMEKDKKEKEQRNEKGPAECKSRDVEGELRLFKYSQDSDKYEKKFTRLARGLRNSMALAYNSKLNLLYQAENNIDASNTPEELNEIYLSSDRTYDFGWPFCFADNELTKGLPEKFTSFCPKKADRPLFLIPQHSAPLGMMYYNGQMHPELSGSLLMTWHGHRREIEQALVSYKTNSSGELLKGDLISSGGYDHQAFEGLISGVAPKGNQPKFRPVGLNTDSRGALWIVDDKNKVLVVYGSTKEEAEDVEGETRDEVVDKAMKSLSEESLKTFDEIYADFYKVQTCTKCHSSKTELPQKSNAALRALFKKGWLSTGLDSRQMPFIERIAADSAKPMPPVPERPFGEVHPQVYQDLKNWIDQNLE